MEGSHGIGAKIQSAAEHLISFGFIGIIFWIGIGMGRGQMDTVPKFKAEMIKKLESCKSTAGEEGFDTVEQCEAKYQL